MISVEAALAQVLALLRPMPAETVALRAAAGRVLAEPVRARLTQPPFAASAMDGYAVREADARPGARLKIVGEAAAGHGFSGALGERETIRIFTGAPLPEGAQRVVIQEDVTRDGDFALLERVEGQDHIRPRGADFREGDALAAPRRLRPADVALVAAMNHDRVRVARRPVVALVATGDELVMPGEAPGPDQIIASNSFGLEALLRAQGAEVRMLPIAPDRPQALADVLALASGADLIVTIGGASVGDHDLVRDVAGTMGLEMSFYKIAMRPGKPLMAGTLNGTPLIGLPGNPVSSMVCANIFLRPAVDRLLGLPAGPLPRSRARLALAVAANGPREHFMRARRLAGDGMPLVEPFDSQDSALLGVLAAADCLLVRPVGDAARDAGEIVEIIDI